MGEPTKSAPEGSDWTRLLTDPDLTSHLATLLQTYREVAPEHREAALLETMRQIKEAKQKARENAPKKPAASVTAQPDSPPAPLAGPEPVTETPPFEPNLFTAQTDSDRRRFARIKCYVAVEIHVQGVAEPIWGNLSNVSRGGCLVETASAVPPNKALEIGLWVANGKLWVKGVVINGIVTHPTQSYGVRVKFSEAELSEKEHLREFLKFVENATRKTSSGNAYMAKLKGKG